MKLSVASLLPAATEIACALGAEEQLVGVSHECDFPASVISLPKLTRARVPASGDTATVHRQVEEVLQSALALFEVDVAGLRQAAPQVILTQDLCDVCAVARSEVEQALQTLDLSVSLVNLRPLVLKDILADIQTTAEAIGRPAEAGELLAGLRNRMRRVQTKTEVLAERPRVVTLEWLQPAMLGGTWMPELIALAGGEPLGIAAGEKSTPWTRAQLAELQPDVVLIKPCGFSLERGLAEVPRLGECLPLEEWPAMHSRRLFLADGNAYFNRPGPRIVDSLELLAHCLHPGEFPDSEGRWQGSLRRILPEGRKS
jgi:iron complex transport system substrate-binding protein